MSHCVQFNSLVVSHLSFLIGWNKSCCRCVREIGSRSSTSIPLCTYLCLLIDFLCVLHHDKKTAITFHCPSYRDSSYTISSSSNAFPKSELYKCKIEPFSPDTVVEKLKHRDSINHKILQNAWIRINSITSSVKLCENMHQYEYMLVRNKIVYNKIF